jgi:predicted Rossmann fold flavoprotein
VTSSADVAVVGAGAAGLATAIFTARLQPALRVVALDGARSLGAKILVSGGGRCNVTNVQVVPADFWQKGSPLLRRVLRAFTVDETVAFFREIGVALREEPGGKLFPETGRARTVLEALLREAAVRGVSLLTGYRVTRVAREASGFVLETSQGLLRAGRVVLATGGLSLPKSGSDGFGYKVAESLGHSVVSPTPALDPLLLEGDFHAPLSGVSHEVEITIAVEGERPVRIAGPLLWTHFGASGPAALNASRFWHRARLRGAPARITAHLLPALGAFEAIEAHLLAVAAERPRGTLHGTLAALLPASVAAAVLEALGLDPAQTLGQLRREERRRLVSALLAWPLPVRGTRGYNFAEVTAGGVPLAEVDVASMESRRCPGLHLVGEILDVDGRIGGFNFQWAWSSARVAASSLARAAGEGR